jgi:hypothetical protein
MRARNGGCGSGSSVTIEVITTQMEDEAVFARAILAEEDAEDVEEAAVDAVEEETILTI